MGNERHVAELQEEIRRAGRGTRAVRWGTIGCLSVPFLLLALLMVVIVYSGSHLAPPDPPAPTKPARWRRIDPMRPRPDLACSRCGSYDFEPLLTTREVRHWAGGHFLAASLLWLWSSRAQGRGAAILRLGTWLNLLRGVYS